ncbi:hypothetical protein Btru_047257 [Bulinus truncatus]|nr:hypothetical protein Btru_047257 [Bulinus truncatus]
MEPLANLTKKGEPNKIIWSDECQRALEIIKTAFAQGPILKLPDIGRGEKCGEMVWSGFDGAIRWAPPAAVSMASFRHLECRYWELWCIRHLVQIITKEEKFSSGFSKCRALNSTMASIHSKEENGFIWSHLSQDKIYWIGTVLESKDSDDVWLDSTTVNYTNWAYFLPNSKYQYQLRTLFVQIQQKIGKWIPKEFDGFTDGYVCKKPAEIASIPTVKPYSTGCLEEGYAYVEYCYTYYHNLTTWEGAQKFCRQRNGNLATVINSVTNDFLSSVFGGRTDFWIGLSIVKSKLIWSSGISTYGEFWERDFIGNRDGCTAMQSNIQLWQLLTCN